MKTSIILLHMNMVTALIKPTIYRLLAQLELHLAQLCLLLGELTNNTLYYRKAVLEKTLLGWIQVKSHMAIQ